MARQTAWVLTLVLTCAAATAALAHERDDQARAVKAQGAEKDKPQPATNRRPDDRWKWWLYDRVELGITDQQSSQINQIFESTIPKLRDARKELDRAEDELAQTIKDHTADVTAVSLLLDRVESARSHHNKLRTLMLYRMHLLLTPEQRSKLAALRARREAENPPPPGHRR